MSTNSVPRPDGPPCITFLLIKNMLDKDGPEVDQVSVRDELIAVDDVVRQVHLEGKPDDIEVRK